MNEVQGPCWRSCFGSLARTPFTWPVRGSRTCLVLFHHLGWFGEWNQATDWLGTSYTAPVCTVGHKRQPLMWFADSTQLCQEHLICRKRPNLEMELTCALSVATFESGSNEPSCQAWHNWEPALLANTWDYWGRQTEVGGLGSFWLDTSTGLRCLGGRDLPDVNKSMQEMTSCMLGHFFASVSSMQETRWSTSWLYGCPRETSYVPEAIWRRLDMLASTRRCSAPPLKKTYIEE